MTSLVSMKILISYIEEKYESTYIYMYEKEKKVIKNATNKALLNGTTFLSPNFIKKSLQYEYCIVHGMHYKSEILNILAKCVNLAFSGAVGQRYTKKHSNL